MIAQTRLHVTLNVHCLSCVLSKHHTLLQQTCECGFNMPVGVPMAIPPLIFRRFSYAESLYANRPHRTSTKSDSKCKTYEGELINTHRYGMAFTASISQNVKSLHKFFWASSVPNHVERSTVCAYYSNTTWPASNNGQTRSTKMQCQLLKTTWRSPQPLSKRIICRTTCRSQDKATLPRWPSH
jgi:hypothetical protein